MADSMAAPRRHGGAIAILVLALCAILYGLGVWTGYRRGENSLPALQSGAFAAAMFGALVGFAEILSRYRDEPLLATLTGPGMAYLTLNGVISLGAFAVMRKYPDELFPLVSHDLFLTAVIAGFGAMAIFRSKLFSFKSSEGKEYPIGPAIVLDTVLKMIDSKIDRQRATERQARVFTLMSALDDFKSTSDYMAASLSSFLNLSEEDKIHISEVIEQYRRLGVTWPEQLKVLGLGFAFLTIAGEENFDLVIRNLTQYIKNQKESGGQVLTPIAR